MTYIGQTGRLRGRLRDLTALYRDEIPFNDPHTAAPCLWVMRTQEGSEFEVSWLPFDGDPRTRKAWECLAISEHRLTWGVSPYANFGRMPDGWVKSSGNNRVLARRDGFRRGFPDPAVRRVPDLPPVFARRGGPASRQWSGLDWSPWEPLPSRLAGTGLYRIRTAGSTMLTYIGQGRLGSRVAAHAAKPGNASHRQARLFAGPLEVSWVLMAGLASQQLLEAECDLITGHVSQFDVAPAAQFLG